MTAEQYRNIEPYSSNFAFFDDNFTVVVAFVPTGPPMDKVDENNEEGKNYVEKMGPITRSMANLGTLFKPIDLSELDNTGNFVKI